MPADRGDCAEDARVFKHTVAHCRTVVLLTPMPELGAVFMHGRDFPPAEQPACRAKRLPLSSRRTAGADSRRSIKRCSGAAPGRERARAAASRSSFEDAATSGLKTLPEWRKVIEVGKPHRRPAGKLFTASAPTRPGCSSTSTAPPPATRACRWNEVFNTLQVYLGALYVNDFNRVGRTWQVNVSRTPISATKSRISSRSRPPTSWRQMVPSAPGHPVRGGGGGGGHQRDGVIMSFTTCISQPP